MLYTPRLWDECTGFPRVPRKALWGLAGPAQHSSACVRRLSPNSHWQLLCADPTLGVKCKWPWPLSSSSPQSKDRTDLKVIITILTDITRPILDQNYLLSFWISHSKNISPFPSGNTSCTLNVTKKYSYNCRAIWFNINSKSISIFLFREKSHTCTNHI